MTSAPLPREHGAWGLLLQPFAAASILAGTWNWLLLPALLSVLLVFLVREPILVLARQRYLWREQKPASAAARRWLLAELLLLAACAVPLAAALSWPLLAALGAMAGLLTAAAVWMTLRNRQRSALLQTVSALGLSASAVLPAALAWPAPWLWPVWGLHALHATGGIFAVHARLELRTRQNPPPSLPVARFAVALAAAAALAAMLAARYGYAIPLAVSALANASELARLRRPDALREPLPRVGLRNLGLSLAFTAVVIAALQAS